MGRPKGGTNRYWSKEAKLNIVKEAIETHQTLRIANQYQISNGMLYKWINLYKTYGEDALINQKKPGNPMAKYSRRKHLSYTEELEYKIMKQEIEIERLKKAYQVKGVGPNKQFATISDVNSKSFKN